MSNTYIRFSEDNSSVILSHPEHIPGGVLPAIPSKSHAHRLLIAAALSDAPVFLSCPVTSADIDATAACLNAIGADITRTETGFMVTPIPEAPVEKASVSILHAGESGSTLRFLLPLLGALGLSAGIHMEGRLPERPLHPLDDEMRRHGISFSGIGSTPLSVSGRLTPGEYSINGGISSQFITGLLFSLPLLKDDSVLSVTGRLESRPYVDITLNVLKQFGIIINEEPNAEFSSSEQVSTVFRIPGGQHFHAGAPEYRVEGDWSNAAFFLAAGALLKDPVTVTGCNMASEQGDSTIVNLLKDFGAAVVSAPSSNVPQGSANSLFDITITGGKLHGTDIDASQIPDLVPILTVVAAFAEGITTIRNIERLRIKESDRVATVMEMIRGIGGSIEELKETNKKEDAAASSYLKITGFPSLPGGTVSSHNDHRIAMAAAIASLRTEAPVTILDPMAVRKSYPGFYDDLKKIF